MAGFSRIDVEGGKELASLLRKIGDKDLQRQLRAAHLQTAALVAAKAREKVPVRSGRLKNTIRPGASQTGAVVRSGDARVLYASAIHWGRRTGNVGSPPGNHQGPNPIRGRRFLWDAGNESIAAATVIYEREVGKVFDQLGRLSKGGSSGA